MKLLFRIFLSLALALTLFAPRAANAEGPRADGIAAPPADAPLVLSSAIKVPPVPTNFQKKDLGWMVLYFPPGLHERAQTLAGQADELKSKLADELGQPVLDHVEVRLARTPEEMSALAPIGVPPPTYAAGVAYSAIHLVLLTMQSPTTAEAPDLDEVFRHELAHIALDDAVLGNHVPRWFNEGLAIYESGELPWARGKSLADAALSKKLLPLSELDQNFPADKFEVNLAYSESADFVRFLMRKTDKDRFVALVSRLRKGQVFSVAAEDAYGSDLRKLEFQWKEDLSRRYTVWPAVLGGSTLWVFAFGALVVGYVRRRRRAKAILARWEKEERDADQALLGATLTDEEPGAPMAEGVLARRSLPVVHHAGRWHTLH